MMLNPAKGVHWVNLSLWVIFTKVGLLYDCRSSAFVRLVPRADLVSW